MNEDNNKSSPNIEPSPGITQPEEFQRKKSFDIPIWAKIALLIVFVALASIGYMKSAFLQKPETAAVQQNDPDVAGVEAREELPDLTLVEADGKTHKLSEYRGQVIVLSFWASWCTPCLVELPTFADIEHKLHDRGFRVLTVNVDDGDEGKSFARDFWQKKNFDFPSFFDSTKELAQKFSVEILPANFVIDRKGRVAFTGFGANDWSSPQTAELLENLLNEKP